MEYILFLMFAVCQDICPDANFKLTLSCQVLFATCACILVRSYAPYAKHSGIPEIKTVLGGFVMKRFMGGWTLAIKSLGLVSRTRHLVIEVVY